MSMHRQGPPDTHSGLAAPHRTAPPHSLASHGVIVELHHYWSSMTHFSFFFCFMCFFVCVWVCSFAAAKWSGPKTRSLHTHTNTNACIHRAKTKSPKPVHELDKKPKLEQIYLIFIERACKFAFSSFLCTFSVFQRASGQCCLAAAT